MKFPAIWTVGIAITIILAAELSNANANGVTQSKRQPKPLDLVTPFEKLSRKFKNFNRNFSIEKIIELVTFFMEECIADNGGEEPPEGFGALLQKDKLQNLSNFVLKHQKEMEVGIKAFLNFNDICNMPWFAMVHNFVWEEDKHKSMSDIVSFFQRFGYPKAYEAIKAFYGANECPQGLIDKLPDGPEEGAVGSEVKNVSVSYNYEKEQEKMRDFLVKLTTSSKKISPFLDFELHCKISELLGKAGATGLLDVGILLLTTVEEMMSKPAIHFLFGKFQEPLKGKSFRELRVKEPIRLFFVEVDSVIKLLLECFLQILSTIGDMMGLDLKNTNLVETAVSIFEIVFWQNWEPVYPPPPDPKPLPC